MKKKVNDILGEYKTKLTTLLNPPYSGIKTFFRAPYKKNLNDIDIALIGLPYDIAVTNRPGARFAPQEVRAYSSSIGAYNHQLKMSPFKKSRIADVGDMILKNIYSMERAIKEIEKFYKKIVSKGIIPLTCGGDHSITYPILKAVGEREPVGLIHFDSHCDTTDEISGSMLQHGSPFYNAVNSGVIDPKRTVQIGIRGQDENIWQFSYDKGISVIHIEEFYEMGWNKVVETVKDVIGEGPVYVSFDIDFLDPAYAPGTGTPEVGGATTFEAQQVLRGLKGLNVVGGDVVEVSPPYDHAGITCMAAASMMAEILCLISYNLSK